MTSTIHFHRSLNSGFYGLSTFTQKEARLPYQTEPQYTQRVLRQNRHRPSALLNAILTMHHDEQSLNLACGGKIYQVDSYYGPFALSSTQEVTPSQRRHHGMLHAKGGTAVGRTCSLWRLAREKRQEQHVHGHVSF